MRTFRHTLSLGLALALSLSLACTDLPVAPDLVDGPQFSAALHAGQTIAYDVRAGRNGIQDFNGSLGLDFFVNAPISIHSLGVFDSRLDGLKVPITAHVYNTITQARLVTVVFAVGFPGTGIGGSRFLPLASPLILPAGFQGTIVAENYQTVELNGNSPGPFSTINTGGGLITFVGGGRFGTKGLFPDNIDRGPVNRYSAGTFVFEPVAHFLVIDEESIDNGNPPNFFSDVDVNGQIADIGLRAQLPFFAANVGETITLHTGEVGDEGWFAPKTILPSWDAAGPTVGDGLRNYLEAGPGLGTPDVNGDREALLDKIPDVTPLRAQGLKLLEGHHVCAVVYDSDVSINYDPLNGSLKGANLGTVAFEVLSVTKLDGFSSSSLPKVDIRILDPETVCEGPLTLFTDAPEPISSS